MQTSVNQFRDNLKKFVEQVINDHEPLTVTRRGEADFVVIGKEDWERHQETMYVLGNQKIMKQIRESEQTHRGGGGHTLTESDLDERFSV